MPTPGDGDEHRPGPAEPVEFADLLVADGRERDPGHVDGVAERPAEDEVAGGPDRRDGEHGRQPEPDVRAAERVAAQPIVTRAMLAAARSAVREGRSGPFATGQAYHRGHRPGLRHPPERPPDDDRRPPPPPPRDHADGHRRRDRRRGRRPDVRRRQPGDRHGHRHRRRWAAARTSTGRSPPPRRRSRIARAGRPGRPASAAGRWPSSRR